MTVRLTNETTASRQVPSPYGNVVAAGGYVDINDTRYNIQAAFAATGTSMAGWGFYEIPLQATAVPAGWVAGVRVRAQTAVTLTGPGATIDGVTMAAGDRFLTNIQGGALPGSTNAANGIYVWNGASLPATRADDLSLGTRVNSLVVKVNEGTDADKIFVCTTEGVVGDAIAFAPSTASAADLTKLTKYPATYGARKAVLGNAGGTAYEDSTITYPAALAGAGADADKVWAANAGGTDMALRTLNPTGATSTNNMGYQAYTAPAGPAAIHAQIDDLADTSPVTTGITPPAIPRNLTCTFGAAWAASPGGDVTIVGTDQDDVAVTEVFAANPAGTTTGVCIFKTVTSIAFAAGAGGAGHTLNVASGNKLGITGTPSAAIGLETVNGAMENATWDIALHQRGFTPTTAPNGARNFAILYPQVATTHTHTNSLT